MPKKKSKPPAAAAVAEPVQPDLGVYMDWQGRTCAVVEEKNGVTSFLCMDENGMRIKRMSTPSFEQHYKRRLTYTVSKWCESTLEFAKYAGASDEAIAVVGNYVALTNSQKEKLRMGKPSEQNKESDACVACEGKGKNSKGEDCAPCKGTGKRKDTAKAAKKTEKPAAAKKDTKAAKKTEKPAAAKKDVKAAKKTEPKEPKAKRETAASMFKELIMAGKLTDEQIFVKVQQKYGLKDDKKWYTSWYRHDLKRKGMNPPDALKK